MQAGRREHEAAGSGRFAIHGVFRVLCRFPVFAQQIAQRVLHLVQHLLRLALNLLDHLGEGALVHIAVIVHQRLVLLFQHDRFSVRFLLGLVLRGFFLSRSLRSGSLRGGLHSLRLLKRVGLRLKRIRPGVQLVRARLIAGHGLKARLRAQVLGFLTQVVRGFALRLLRLLALSEVKHQFAAHVAHLVDRVARGLLRVLHALVHSPAHVLERAARGVVHVAHKLLGLRHDALAKAAQRRKRLVERLAKVKLCDLLFFLRLCSFGSLGGFGGFGILGGFGSFGSFGNLRCLWFRGAPAVHLVQQVVDVLQGGRNLSEGFLLGLAARYDILVARLRVGQQLVPQSQVFRGHLHLGKDPVDHAANALVHHLRFLHSNQPGNHSAVLAPVRPVFFIQFPPGVRQMIIPPARARVFIAPIALDHARAFKPPERGVKRRLFQLQLPARDFLHILADDVAVAILMVELPKDDRVGVAAKDIRCIEHFITSVAIMISRYTSPVKVSRDITALFFPSVDALIRFHV